MENPLNEIVTQEKDVREKRVNDTMKTIKDELAFNDLRPMPEDIFNNVFLPYFDGSLVLKKGDPIIAKWVNFTGNPRRGANIVNESGQVVRVIPGIISTTPVDFVTNLNIDLPRIGMAYEKLRERSSEQADMKIHEVTKQIADALDRNMEPNLKAFKKIMEDGDSYKSDSDDDFVIYD